jgi:hypothetical protein
MHSVCSRNPLPNSAFQSVVSLSVALSQSDFCVLTGALTSRLADGQQRNHTVHVRNQVEEGPKGIKFTCLAIDKTIPGVSFGENELKMGWRSQPTRILALDAVKVRKTRIIGKEDDGFKIAMKSLDGGRINIASCSLGSVQRCLEYARCWTAIRALSVRRLLRGAASRRSVSRATRPRGASQTARVSCLNPFPLGEGSAAFAHRQHDVGCVLLRERHVVSARPHVQMEAVLDAPVILHSPKRFSRH